MSSARAFISVSSDFVNKRERNKINSMCVCECAFFMSVLSMFYISCFFSSSFQFVHFRWAILICACDAHI